MLAHLFKSDPYTVRVFESVERKVAPVICYAYSPPGCIISANGKAYFETFCTSIVVGNDVVTRMSKRSLKQLNGQIGGIIRGCNHPKTTILAGLVGRLISRRFRWASRFIPPFLVPKVYMLF